jgi:hypothetical protein
MIHPPGTNVAIRHYRAGQLVEARDVHNAWVNNGRGWLSKLVSLQVLDPGNPAGDVAENNARIRYFGLGMGGHQASASSLVPPYSTYYQPGADPNATAGNEYRSDFASNISTLERPVRRSGTLDPYPGDPADVWLYEDIPVWRRDTQSVTFNVSVDATGGELIYGALTDLPISEAGLFTDDTGVSINQPYSPLIAYVNFGTIQLTTSSIVLFSWTVRFADAP